MRTPYHLGQALCAVLLFASGLFAAPAEKAVGEDARKESVQDVLVLADSRPIVFRIHLEVAGKPVTENWQAYIRALCAFVDRDGDGVLGEKETKLLPPPQQLNYHLRGVVVYAASNSQPVPFSSWDRNKDGKVEAAEVMRFYQASGIGPVQVVASYSSGTLNNRITDLLFARLDAKKDGGLSREDMEQAVSALARFDENDDEIVSAREVQGLTTSGYVFSGGGRPVTTGLFLINAIPSRTGIDDGVAIANAVLPHYDRNKDGKLALEELGLPREMFTYLDANSDGALERLELVRLNRLQPEVEAVVRVATADSKARAIEILKPARGVEKVKNLASTVRQTSRMTRMATPPDSLERVSLALRGEQFELARAPGQSSSQVQNYRAYFDRQMKALDTDNQGFITKEQVKERKYLYLRNLLTVADRDEDGKLTTQEVDAYFALQSKASGTVISVMFQKTGQGLFAMLDKDGDGRLSVRELRTSWSRLEGIDANGDGQVQRAEIPQHYHLTVSQGTPRYYPQQGMMRVPRAGTPQRTTPQRGPVWFRKMDENQDGDVSAREFLGPRAAFARIDKDGDGLISAEEAEKASK